MRHPVGIRMIQGKDKIRSENHTIKGGNITRKGICESQFRQANR